MTGRVIVGVLWLTMMVVIAGAWSAGALRAERQGQTAQPVMEPRSGPTSAPTSTPAPDAKHDTRPVVDDQPNNQLDLYGNEIEEAVGDYRIDFEGEVYERHAPQVEVHRLAAASL